MYKKVIIYIFILFAFLYLSWIAYNSIELLSAWRDVPEDYIDIESEHEAWTATRIGMYISAHIPFAVLLGASIFVLLKLIKAIKNIRRNNQDN